MGWFRNLFFGIRESEKSEEKVSDSKQSEPEEPDIEERVRFLISKLSDNEFIRVRYGASEELIKYCSRNKVDYPLLDVAVSKTKAEIAKEELCRVYVNSKAPMKAIALAGRALGFKPIEILRHYKEMQYSKKTGQVVLDFYLDGGKELDAIPTLES